MPKAYFTLPKAHLEFAEIICAIHRDHEVCTTRRDHKYNPPRSYVQSAEIICTIRRGLMFNPPRSYVKSAGTSCTFCRDHTCNLPRSYVPFAKVTCRRGAGWRQEAHPWRATQMVAWRGQLACDKPKICWRIYGDLIARSTQSATSHPHLKRSHACRGYAPGAFWVICCTVWRSGYSEIQREASL